ncbi:hypothetical protein U6A24_22870 [Aquimarina gracilis]|uniref:Uncharacterized protein n=1 Tax=Aquimarina gracilis TaxID=874422 RepID=A0ABU6A2E6_9FLAO|nr:hypothetical protein [Aquimarina gracilis]MEB3348338.1 hypothetical protein [Aquimarina gracilis]
MPGIKEINISKLSYFILLITLSVSCQKNENLNLIKISSLPNAIHEISGIVMLSDNKLYAINDSGNAPILFRLNQKGEILSEINVPNAKNKDWEDLAYDLEDNIYIGDFGNNNNDRKDLKIYKVSGILSDTIVVSKIKFAFEDQKKFPPKKKNFNFDVEAFIHFNGNLYLFTKNRAKESIKTTKIYKIPATPGKHIAKLIGRYETCKDPSDCLVTGASINKSQNKIALLTHNKIFLFHKFKGDHILEGDVTKIKLGHTSQKESICFKNDSTFFIADEKTRHKKAKLYEFKLPPIAH